MYLLPFFLTQGGTTLTDGSQETSQLRITHGSRNQSRLPGRANETRNNGIETKEMENGWEQMSLSEFEIEQRWDEGWINRVLDDRDNRLERREG